MRDFKNMKRQRGRNRGGGGSGGGGGKPQHNVNRAFDSNGPDNVKIRGHAQHVFEKYQQLARDAFASGDRVLAENYLQHADHYFRVLRTIQPQRPAAEILGRDVFASGLDIDFEEEMDGVEEGGEVSQPEGEASDGQGSNPGQDGRREPRRDYDNRNDRYENRDRQDRGERNDRPDRDRQDRDRQDRGDRQGFEPRESRGYEGRRDDNRSDRGEAREPRRDNDRYENRDRPERAERGDRDVRRDEPRGEGRGEGRREGRRYREDRPPREDRAPRDEGSVEDVRDPLAVVSVTEASSFPSAEAEPEASPVLRSQDGGFSEAPAFLQGAPPSAEDGEVRKPRARRRRAPRSFEGGEEGGEAAEAPTPAPEDA